MLLQQIAFVLVSAAAIWFFTKNVRRLRANILQGRSLKIDDQPAQRWRNVALLALGQKKMFKKVIPATLHFIVYAGFIIINLEVLEIILDGVFGTHRLFAKVMSPGAYGAFISAFELLAAGVLVSVIIFLIRRHMLLLPRFRSPEMKGWPSLDADIILYVEISLMLAFLVMDAADWQLQQLGAAHYPVVGPFLVSQWISPLFEGLSQSTLVGIERAGWWFHILGIYAFLNYVPYSKHLHIFLAFPNAYYAPLESQGKVDNMPTVAQEVQNMMDPDAAPEEEGADAEEVPSFGARDVGELNWRHLLGAYSCTECGRCTAACPASQTGKLLSPRKIMMDTRDRAAELGAYKAQHGADAHDGKQLLSEEYITEEEIRACTTCQACVEACPVQINPLSIIIELRRYAVMEESSAPNQWNVMFGNIENNMAPWQFSPEDRLKWAEELAEERYDK
jgi:heterodisulfide reductase subunit C